MKKLDGKIALITGGSSGIGLTTAKLFAEHGAKVIITGRNNEQLEKAEKELGVKAFRSDSSVMSDIDDLYAKVKEHYGRIDILFLNAGIAPFMPLEVVNEEHYDKLMNTNVKGLYFGVQKALPLLKSGSSIIFTSSGVNVKGFPGATVYSATKAAVRSLARSMSAELVEKGIRVNVVSPGPIETPIFNKVGVPEDQLEGMKKGFTEMVPMKRFGKPEEIASAALFLASEDSSYMLGSEIMVDGGLTEL